MDMQMDESQLSQQKRELMQQTMQPQENNPFAMAQYNPNYPDIPLVSQGGIAEQLLGNDSVPEDVAHKFWFVFHKDNVLTFLDQERKDMKLIAFDIAKIDELSGMPYFDYTFNMESQWNIVRNALDVKLDRSMGFKGQGSKNERIILQSQFNEVRQIHDQSSDNAVKEGFFKRLLGRK